QQLIIPVDPLATTPAISLTPPVDIESVLSPTVEKAHSPYSISEKDTLYACPPHTTVTKVSLPAEPIRLILATDMAYMIANGDLYRLPLSGLKDQSSTPINLIPSERKVSGYVIQE